MPNARTGTQELHTFAKSTKHISQTMSISSSQPPLLSRSPAWTLVGAEGCDLSSVGTNLLRDLDWTLLVPWSCPVSEEACQSRRPHIALRNSGWIPTHPLMALSHRSVLTTSESPETASAMVGLKRVAKNDIRPLRTSHFEVSSSTSATRC